MNYDRVKYHKHCRKYEQYNNRTDHCTSCKQGTDRTDHIYLRIKSYSKGCSKETASTYNNGLHGEFMRYGDSFLLCLAKMTLFLIIAGHQDRIVNGCSQLDSSDYDTCYERKGNKGLPYLQKSQIQ